MEANNNLLVTVAKPSDYRSISRHLLLAFRSLYMRNGRKHIAHKEPYLMHNYIKKKKSTEIISVRRKMELKRKLEP